MSNVYPGFTPVLLKRPDFLATSVEHPSGAQRALGRVLVVNDSSAKHYAVVLPLRSDGFDVVEAASANEARLAAVVRPPDAVVIDLSVPESESFDICDDFSRAVGETLDG